MKRTAQFLSMVGIIGLSVIAGMVLGGRLNSPDFAMALPQMERGAVALPAARAVPEVVTDFADVVEDAIPAVVSVTSTANAEEDDSGNSMRDSFRWFFGQPDEEERFQRRRPQLGEGTGFVVTGDGYVLTNNHVVEGADVVTVGLSDGRTFKAEVVGTDPSIDLALLKLDTDESLPTLPLGDSDGLRVGQWVIAIGNPLDYEHTVTVGVVSAKKRRVPLRGTDFGVANFIQTDAAINLGNSGGPLLDAGGNVIGINTAITRANYAEGIGFALPINQARLAMEQLRATGKVRRGFIGITMNQGPIDPETRDYYGLPDTNGVLVNRVEPSGPADDAGVKPGDIIRRVDGAVVRDNTDLIGRIAMRLPGEKVDLQIFRDGETIDVTAVLGDREEGLRAQTGMPAREEEEPEEEVANEGTGLGLTVENLDPYRERFQLDEEVKGVIVTDVEFDSQAMDKGLQPSMIIISIDDQEIDDVRGWNQALRSLRPGRTVKIEVLAGGQGRLVFLRVPEE